MAGERVTVRVAVVGASGYVGGELLRLLATHPSVTLTTVTSEKSAGQPVSQLFPNLTNIISLSFESLDIPTIAQDTDVVFLALPHTHSLLPTSQLLAAGVTVIDLSADYRLQDPTVYKTWYETTHSHPELLQQAVYGLPELHRALITKAQLIASPGCYPTAAILQLAPLAAHGLIQAGSIIIDAKSGISGAGRSPALAFHFPESNESIEAYKIGRHRHIPEIEQELTRLTEQTSSPEPLTVTFTPHLVPMNRGILSTAYCHITKPLSLAEIQSLYTDFYKGEQFIRLLTGEQRANPRHVRGSNYCDIAIYQDPKSGRVISTAALDNLVKGAAGQALQAMNIRMGFPEHVGLTAPGIFP